jgi:flagellar protein FlgJ
MLNNTNSINGLISNLSGNRSKSVEDRISNINKKSFDKTLEKSLQMNEKKNNTISKIKDKKLMNVCVEMESIFVAKMLKEMRKTVHKNDMFHGGFAEEIFEDMLYDQYSLQVSKESNLGLAKMLYDDLSRK